MATAREWVDQGNAYMSKREYQKAIEAYTEAIQLRPVDALGYGQRGFAYLSLHQFARAMADFTESIQYDPNDMMAYYGRGMALWGLGDRVKALNEIRRASTASDPTVRSMALDALAQLSNQM